MTTASLTRARVQERLLHGGGDRDHRSHHERYGAYPRVRRHDRHLLAEIAASGLAGRGGADFPTARKLSAVAARRRTAAVANGTEGEPMSAKDAVLLTHNPHLVLDGLAVVSDLLGAGTATIAVSEGTAVAETLEWAIAQRSDRREIQLACLPDRFVSGEESALVNALAGGAALPTGRRPYAEGVLVQNVETLAHLALVARHGAGWFRAAGTDAEPGTALATISGAVASPGVLEFEFGATLGEVFERSGGLTEQVDAVLVGGYHGRWLHADADRELSNEALSAHGGSLGARVIVALGRSSCGLAETARVIRYLAGESAGQCGPCLFGLPALADAFDSLVDGRDAEQALERLLHLRAQITRRGACHHPDGTLGFAMSALAVFAGEAERHSRGLCSATAHAPVLKTPAVH